MLGRRPGERLRGATDGTFAAMLPHLPEESKFLRDYDMQAMSAMLAQLSHLPFAEKLATIRKNREQFRKHDALAEFLNNIKSKAKDEKEEEEVKDEDEEEVKDEDEDEGKGSDDEDEEDDEDEDEEDDEDDDEEALKLHRVPNEGEPECKKPRLAEGSGCSAKAAV
ncbi:unnamed protein product [Alopecurus aequalis]